MSKTNKKEYTKHHIAGRKNEYGLCPCANCRMGRNKKGNLGLIEKIKHKFRTEWKTNKRMKKGIYTD